MAAGQPDLPCSPRCCLAEICESLCFCSWWPRAAERQKPLASLTQQADGATPCFFCCADGTGLGLVRLLGSEWRGPPLPQGLGLLWARSLLSSLWVVGKATGRACLSLCVCALAALLLWAGGFPRAGCSALGAAACLGCVCVPSRAPGRRWRRGLLDTWHQVAPPRPQRAAPPVASAPAPTARGWWQRPSGPALENRASPPR